MGKKIIIKYQDMVWVQKKIRIWYGKKKKKLGYGTSKKLN